MMPRIYTSPLDKIPRSVTKKENIQLVFVETSGNHGNHWFFLGCEKSLRGETFTLVEGF